MIAVNHYRADATSTNCTTPRAKAIDSYGYGYTIIELLWKVLLRLQLWIADSMNICGDSCESLWLRFLRPHMLIAGNTAVKLLSRLLPIALLYSAVPAMDRYSYKTIWLLWIVLLRLQLWIADAVKLYGDSCESTRRRLLRLWMMIAGDTAVKWL